MFTTRTVWSLLKRTSKSIAEISGKTFTGASVDNVQGGKDECQITEINWPDLLNLKSLCLAALKYPSDAASVLPVRQGFFFGTYDYDEYYMQDLRTTIGYIEKMQEMKKENPQTRFFYNASW
jgi:hypothetical protein